MSLTHFIDIFEMPGNCLRGKCACGKVFYVKEGGNFGERELATLEASKNAFSSDEFIVFLRMDAKEYVTVCDCWHQRAFDIMIFLEEHTLEVIAYLKRGVQKQLSHLVQEREETEASAVFLSHTK